MAIQLEASSEIEPVRGMPRVAGIKVNCIAPKVRRVPDQPVKQHSCKPLPPRLFERRHVIDVQHLPPGEEFENPEACSAPDSAVMPESQHLERLRSLAPNLGDELLMAQMGTKDGERLEAGLDIRIGVRKKDFRLHVRPK